MQDFRTRAQATDHLARRSKRCSEAMSRGQLTKLTDDEFMAAEAMSQADNARMGAAAARGNVRGSRR